MEGRSERINAVLRAQFEPLRLEVTDESARHAGHAVRNGVTGSETHFHIAMVSNKLKGLSRLDRSRAVHEALAGEFATGLHALALSLRTAEEENR